MDAVVHVDATETHLSNNAVVNWHNFAIQVAAHLSAGVARIAEVKPILHLFTANPTESPRVPRVDLDQKNPFARAGTRDHAGVSDAVVSGHPQIVELADEKSHNLQRVMRDAGPSRGELLIMAEFLRHSVNVPKETLAVSPQGSQNPNAHKQKKFLRNVGTESFLREKMAQMGGPSRRNNLQPAKQTPHLLTSISS